jgi:hypothetical protein
MVVVAKVRSEREGVTGGDGGTVELLDGTLVCSGPNRAR